MPVNTVRASGVVKVIRKISLAGLAKRLSLEKISLVSEGFSSFAEGVSSFDSRNRLSISATNG